MKKQILIYFIILSFAVTFSPNLDKEIADLLRNNKQYGRRPLQIGMFGTYLSNNSQSDIPLKDLSYNVSIYNSLVRVEIQQIYENSFNEAAIETQYYFAISPSSAFVELTVEIDGKKLSGSIKEKQQARKEYEQAKSEGKLAAIAEIVSEVHDVMKLNLGNLGPRKQAIVTLVYLDLLEISINKYWKFAIGNTFSERSLGHSNVSPDMKNVANPKTVSHPAYLYNMTILIESTSPISFIESTSHPHLLFNQIKNNKNKYKVSLSNEIPNKEFVLLYSDENIHHPAVRVGQMPSAFTELEYPYSAFITFFPGFDLTFVDNKIKGARIEFIFLVDRSGSMGGNRIEMTKSVLLELMDKLPADSYFNIVSFGSFFQEMFSKSVNYNQENKEQAKKQIILFQADFGGTEILTPLRYIQNIELLKGYDKVIFLLTDGQVYNENEIVSLIRENFKTRVYTIGIGNGVSKNMIIEAAVEGLGKFEFVSDLQMLSEKMQYLLDDAVSPFLENFKIIYDDQIIKLASNLERTKIRKNEPFNFFCLLNNQLQNTTITIQYYDSIVNSVASLSVIIRRSDAIQNPIIHQIVIHQLLRMKLNDKLYSKNITNYYQIVSSMEANSVELENEYQQLVQLSIQYQVLTELTAIVLVDYSEDLQQRAKGEPVKLDVPLVKSVDYDQTNSSIDSTSSFHQTSSNLLDTMLDTSQQSMPNPKSANPGSSKKSYDPQDQQVLISNGTNQNLENSGSCEPLLLKIGLILIAILI